MENTKTYKWSSIWWTVNADLNVVDLLDVINAGSGKIITDAERAIITNINDVISNRIDNQHISNNGEWWDPGIKQ